MKFLNTDQFALPGTQNRFIHLATIAKGAREFIYLIDRETYKRYIEEITGGHLELIKDDNLAKELEDFANYNKLGEILITPDSSYLINNPELRKIK